jgi:hypothetical protein
MKIIETQSFKEKIPKGRSSGKKPSDFSAEQIQKGIEIELEHTSNNSIAQEIAMDHLEEFSDYYKELEKMETKLKQPQQTKPMMVAPMQ